MSLDLAKLGAPFKLTPIDDIRSVKDDKFVAAVFGAGAEQKKARGQLFVASDDLYSAALEMLDALDKADSTTVTHPAAKALRNAVAKAEGKAS